MNVEQVAIEQLKQYPNNPRKGNIDLIAESLESFGQFKPVTVNKQTMEILAGNHTVQAAKKLGWKTVAVAYVDVDAETAAKIVAVDNRSSETGQNDNEALLELLEQLDNLDNTGYSTDDVEDLYEFLEHPFETVTMNIRDLKQHPNNYQEHPADQIQHLIESINAHGFYRNIVIANDNTILAGHGVVKAATEMGKKRVPVIRLDISPDDPRALKVLISDNEINNLAEVDDRALTELLKQIMEDDEVGLLGTGFDESQLTALVFNTRHASEIQDKDEAAEWVGLPDHEMDDPALKIVVSFADEHDRQLFAKTLGYRITEKTKSVWFPDKPKDDVSSIRIEDE